MDIKIILLYSARKKNAKIIDEYSRLNPATNSASASGRSKGVLLVSATIEIKNIIDNGNKGPINQKLSRSFTIFIKFKELELKKMGIKIIEIEIS